jgi:hypothetical protein
MSPCLLSFDSQQEQDYRKILRNERWYYFLV